MAASVSGSPWTPEAIGDQTGKVALVTGANAGIGYWTALHLARRGAHVVMACRSVDRAATAREELLAAVPTGSFEVLPLDLADLSSVRTAAARFSATHPHLDILVNNAGVAMLPRSLTADGFELHLGANFLGHVALTGLVLPSLLAAPEARVVHVGSLQHRFGKVDLDDPHFERRRYRPWSAYGQSKVATLLFMAELDRRFRRAGASAISLGSHPGAAGTGIIEEMPLIGSPRLRGAAEVIGGWFPAPEQAAHPGLFAATAPGLRGGEYLGPTGRFEIGGPPGPARVGRRARDAASAVAVWDLACRLTDVRFDGLEGH